MKKIILLTAISFTLTGCMSLKTEMVNAKGDFKNCEATGGGLGLGAVVGVALAAASRSSCVTNQKSIGFLEVDSAGTLDINFSTQGDAVLTVSESNVKDILEGDRILEVDHNTVTTPEEFQSAAFGPIDKPVEIKLTRADLILEKTAGRTRIQKTKTATN